MILKHLVNMAIIHKGSQARIQKCGLGVECRRHSIGGAEGVDGGGVGEGISWGGVWGGAVPPPPKNFGIFSFEMVHFDAFWTTL